MKRTYTFTDGTTKEEFYTPGDQATLESLSDLNIQNKYFPDMIAKPDGSVDAFGNPVMVYTNPLISVVETVQ